MSNTDRTRYWEEQLTAWQSSGASGQAFCKEQGLVYHQFTYWRRKLLANDNEIAADKNAGLIQVTPAPQRSEPSAYSESALTLSLPGGIAITGIHAGNVTLLGDILRQL